MFLAELGVQATVVAAFVALLFMALMMRFRLAASLVQESAAVAQAVDCQANVLKSE